METQEYEVKFIGEMFNISVITEAYDKDNAEENAKYYLINNFGIDLFELYGLEVEFKVLGQYA